MADENRQTRGKAARARRRAAKKSGKAAAKPEPVNPNATRAMLIANPVAGNNAYGRVSDDLLRTLKDLGLDFDTAVTEYHEHAIELARGAANAGYGIVVAVGGDGTVYEVINGLMAVEREKRPRLGVVPVGRGSDFCRTVEIPLDWMTAASMVASGRRRKIDVGWMEYMAPDGVRTGYFVNIAGLGFDGEVMDRANNMPEAVSKTVGGIGSYVLSMVMTYATFHEKDVELQVDGGRHRVLANSVVIANCRFLGGKMQIAPDAACDDGLLDVVVLGAGYGAPELDEPAGGLTPHHSFIERTVAKVKIATKMPRIYQGTHVGDDSVLVLRGTKVKVTCDDRMILQADGEVIGEAPFTAEIVPGALEIIA